MSNPDRSIDPRLLASAEEEFLKQGFLKAELKTICKNAGITTGALYKRFKGKEELFAAIVESIVNELETFLSERSAIDLSLLSDEDIYRSWLMSYEAMLPMFHMIYQQREKFTLLIDRASGTRYESFNHDYVTRMSYAYEKYYTEVKKRGMARADITSEEFHVLLSSFWTCICEPIIHGMTWDRIEEHCRIVCRFFNWKEVIILTKGDHDNV